jgi:hypothetical protein
MEISTRPANNRSPLAVIHTVASLPTYCGSMHRPAAAELTNTAVLDAVESTRAEPSAVFNVNVFAWQSAA